MIDAIRGLCSLLAGSTTAETLANRLGVVTDDQGGLTAIRVEPSSTEFRDATIVRAPDGSLSHVDVELASPTSVPELVAAFGEPSRPPRAPHGSPKLVFRSGSCVLIADAPDGGEVTTISVRSETE